MSIPFANSAGLIQHARLCAYLETVAPKTLRAELPTWAADPTDILTCADAAREFHHEEHALVLYGYALDALERNPGAIRDDTELGGAYYFYGKTLLRLRRATEAIKPLTTATTMDPQEATNWYMLGTANALARRFDDSIRCFERVLSLEGVDEDQDAAFFEDVRERIALAKQELAGQGQRGSPSAVGNDGPIEDIGAARNHLAGLGIEFDGNQVIVRFKPDRYGPPMKIEVCTVLQDGGSFNVRVQNLPRFFGANWREMSGGKPVLYECQSAAELVELLETMVASRMVNGFLPMA